MKNGDSLEKKREFQRWGVDNQNEINQKRVELERNIATGLLKVIRKIGMRKATGLSWKRTRTLSSLAPNLLISLIG
jgi:hypothetical protein